MGKKKPVNRQTANSHKKKNTNFENSEDPKFSRIPVVKLIRVDISKHPSITGCRQGPVVSLQKRDVSEQPISESVSCHPKVQIDNGEVRFLTKINNCVIPKDTTSNIKVGSALDNHKGILVKKLKSFQDKVENIRKESPLTAQMLSPSNSKKVLRVRKQVNYKERPSTVPSPVVADSIRVPIYKQKLVKLVGNEGNKRNPYDFVIEPGESEDSDVSFHLKTPAKKRKFVHRDHIKREPRKIKYDNLNAVNKVNKAGRCESYQNKIDNVLNGIRAKINSKKIKLDGVKSQENKKEILNGINVSKKKSLINKNVESIFNSTQIHFAKNISFPDQSQIFSSGNSVNIDKSRVSEKQVFNISNNRNSNIVNKSNINLNNLKNVIANTSLCLNEYNELAQKEHEQNTNEYNAMDTEDRDFDMDHEVNAEGDVTWNNSDEFNNVENHFGFNEDEENTDCTVNNGRINIVQNVVLDVSKEINLSVTNNRRCYVKSPWRLDTRYISRNPYFIHLKDNHLPCLNQDPIINHTFEDHIKEVNTTVLIPTSKKSPKQQSMLNYIQTDKDHPREKLLTQSLYDVEELSPIKIRNTDKENSGENKREPKKRKAKRNILGELNLNVVTNQTSTPAKRNQLNSIPMELDLSLIETNDKDDSNIVDDNFGFDTCSEVIEEENIGICKDKAAGPFRVGVYSKKRINKKLRDLMDKPVRDSEIRRLVEDDSQFRRIAERDDLECGEGKLFEDIEVPANITRSYTPRTKRRPGFLQQGQKKIKEDKLSKKAVKWIKEFNKMCEEVDEVELELE